MNSTHSHTSQLQKETPRSFQDFCFLYNFTLFFLCVLCCVAKGLQGKQGKVAYLEKWVSTISCLTSASDAEFWVTFDWDHEKMGVPGAFIIRNHHKSQFYLKTVTIEGIPGHDPVNFVCNSWVYPAHRYTHDRVFFSNKVTSFHSTTSSFFNITTIEKASFVSV